MKLFNGLWGVALAAVIAGSASAAPQPVNIAGNIKMHEGDWTGNLVTCRLIQIILEDEMNYKVRRVSVPAGSAIWEAVRNGETDMGCETWPTYNPDKSRFFEQWGGDGSIQYMGPVGIVGQSGYYVPRYVIEGDAERGIEAVAPDLKTFAQLNHYKDVFKTLESGDKGSIFGCPVAAWLCADTARIEGFGLDFVAVELGSDTAHFAEMVATYKRGEPFVAYAWEPHWIFAATDLVELTLPQYSEDAWPVSDWAEDITFNYGNPDVMEKHPDVAHLLANQYLTNKQQAVMLLAIDVDNRDLDEVVREWMVANEDVWKTWMPAR